MKNKEIVELLNNLKWYANADNEPDYSGEYPPPMEWEQGEVKLLLSHIEQLENLCNKYEQEHKTTFEIWKKDIKKLEQLENNRDKAIEILERHTRYSTEELLNILKR